MTRLHVSIQRRLEGVDLDVQLDAGAETVVLFGPSGAGKTSVLNAIAGLLVPDRGEIAIDGRTVFRRLPGAADVLLPPRERRVGYVFQDYALFPHLSALENVMYPLRRRADRRERALALLDGLGMERFAALPPAQLSGGQQQRVALARALALESSVLLLDEPFSALDGAVRERLQHDLKSLQRERRLALIIVTHDLDDAFAVGDRLAVLREGRIEQIGPVADVFRRPATNGVADAVGVRNVLRARVLQREPSAQLVWQGAVLDIEHGGELPPAGEDVIAYIRPEDVKIIYPDRDVAPAIARNLIDATIITTREAAGHRVLQVRTDNDATLEVRFPRLSYSTLRLVPGERVRIALRSTGITVLGT